MKFPKKLIYHNNPLNEMYSQSGEDSMREYDSDVSSDVKAIDRELEELLKKQSAKIKVVGVGGGGNNSLGRMREIGIKGGELIAVNTDAQDLLYTNADQKILIGKELTSGLGAGSNPSVGREAAKESASEIKKKLNGADMVFITCGLGGGTGTGAAPEIAKIAKKQGALTIGVVTLPFTIEGRKRIENAMEGLERMEANVDTLIVIPNDKLLELAPELPLHTAFKISDEILTNAVKGVTELVTTPGLVNLDFADIRAVMVDGGVSLIGMGESDTANRALDAVEKAIDNPLLDVDISGATGALVNIIGGADMSLDECKVVMETVGNRLSPNAKMIWGAKISPDMEKSIRVLLIVTGVKSSQILGHGESMKDIKHREIEDELGIEFFEQ
ncbi:cell division protein FtsZ [Candidatus Pacearchaeota archaeon]|nr:cell division protein FtsZ [Candidatus Pacearchaeota archaeon]